MKILFVHQGLQSFVQRDLDILRSTYEVRPIKFTGRKGLSGRLLPDLWKLWRGVIWCDLTFSWFGKLQAFFAVFFSKMLGKKSVVVAGGDDVGTYVHSGRAYTLPSHPLKKWFAYFLFRNADSILAVSELARIDTIRNVGARSENVALVYHGFNHLTYQKLLSIEKQPNLVTTVGFISLENYDRKGFRLFVESARLLPEVAFLVVGDYEDDAIKALKAIAANNVTFTGWVHQDKLMELLSQTMVYVQASENEHFGCSVAEAMLCECVPVVSCVDNVALPEVVGDCGFYLNNLESEELAAKIQLALRHPEMGKQARQRIIENFPLEKRKQALIEVINSLT